MEKGDQQEKPSAGQSTESNAVRKLDLNLRMVLPSRRRKGVARHKKESFADMAFRLGGGTVARGQQ